MSEPLNLANPETRKGDEIRAAICPERVLQAVDGTAATVDGRADRCILCGQCGAVCPTDSLRMPELPSEDFRELARPPFGYGEFLDFLKLRRSVRVFKDRPVKRELTGKILDAAATAPMGLPPHFTEIIVIDRRGELDLLLEELDKEHAAPVKGLSSPLGRIMIRLSAGAESYRALRDFVVDVARQANEACHRDGTDRCMYRAPVLMLFHGSRRALSYEENAHLVCHHAMLAALSLGLGTTITGMIPPIVNRSRVLRERYAIPRENQVLTSFILGHPRYGYRKSIRRELAGVRMI